MRKIIREYRLGDMQAYYISTEDQRQVELLLIPAGEKIDISKMGNNGFDSMVQLKLVGDIYNDTYAMGNTMRNSETVRRLKYVEQVVQKSGNKTDISTYLSDSRGYEIIHHLLYKKGTPYLKVYCEFKNQSEEAAVLEMFESFSLSGISSALFSGSEERMRLHRIRSVWSAEGRIESIPLEDLQLETAWDPHAVRCEKFGQVGSMPVNKFFPFAALEDMENHIFWGVQIACPASWQIEAYRKEESLALSGGLADRDFGHWYKEIPKGGEFSTPKAIISVCKGDSVDILSHRLTAYALEGLENAPLIEKELPIIFNEYCTTWGNPSAENIGEILNAIKDKGFSYFVIDCGWYKEKNIPWDESMGDYNVSGELFPEGLGKTAADIRRAGMVPGIWFEIETAGRASEAYHMEEHLIKKDGKVLTSYARRFWDMRDPWVQDYLEKKVIRLLKMYDFGYMKIDYNETIGIGCDGAESLGEGLRQNMECSKRFIEQIKKQVNGIVLENCASGGHRLEPGLMSQMSMASFSDAHECIEIPIIAANLHRVIHPAQSQIWAVIRKGDSIQRIVYSLCSTFLGRMCLSGDVTELSQDQWNMIEKGMGFYKKIVPVIRKGCTYRFGSDIKSYRHPEGWQGIVRIGEQGKILAVLHTFRGMVPNEIEITIPEYSQDKTYSILEVYAEDSRCIRVEGGSIIYYPSEELEAVTVLIQCRTHFSMQ
ncbi:alpha-galactosidase [Lactonifactor longoviformis]|uniref:Alpha-galactosidase n=1 Tax=Lactonifactor longoviformis DSM 17459 TaxID=1122155 RepID=A0A1M4Y5M3_9CLOT|nr:glycoside hydrolase family 36 protein [Lactonifactor longoviformis]POP34999.1 alpha-galactosidase [Lactonifactor longoviformis]SHF00916.1 alpha-galactosidase [Lactonifactor longoviformis DSM 17459]